MVHGRRSMINDPGLMVHGPLSITLIELTKQKVYLMRFLTIYSNKPVLQLQSQLHLQLQSELQLHLLLEFHLQLELGGG